MLISGGEEGKLMSASEDLFRTTLKAVGSLPLATIEKNPSDELATTNTAQAEAGAILQTTAAARRCRH